MTAESFLAFYPQFSVFSAGVVLPEYIRQANVRFGDFGTDAEEARRLYVAHRLTLYAASSLPEGENADMESIAAAARGALQDISSRKVGEVSITYSTAYFAASAAAGFRDLPATVYGLQLQSLLKLYGFSKYYP